MRYEQNDITASKAILNQCPAENVETMIGEGCLKYKEEKYDEAKEKFTEAMNIVGYRPDLEYNIALCYYAMKDFEKASVKIHEIIEKAVSENPQLSVGSASTGVNAKSVGNTQILRETFLVEAFNLKAAICFQNDPENPSKAKECLADMPPRDESELDPVTLHNVALLNIDEDTNECFQKLNFLIQQPAFPPVTFGNLLTLYIKHGFTNLAADVMAENALLRDTCLEPVM